MKNFSLRELAKTDGRVYVLLPDRQTGERFMREAEKEGFVFSGGGDPTEREHEEIMAVNHDFTLGYVGTNGRIAYQSGADKVGGERLIRIDYSRI